ncbi:hypothetical protein BIY24_09725 [Halobacteriovorax marinus]|uniref:Transmembrane protein n=1 Tax=Halobacteriovorax marinus (strain ATCC BAA-682 / DSM 15412 / SJ) TaxID=862908 RepID=E1X355_HALMS|nr:heparan-alpha-glucosaminide N-acetyltransferase [Halobacteriovorax marinus]ATH08218.1 hypothetical protein BIY24_09725 [Halobacteriovorax marinus]CBW26885.1 putative transmembrane protein [Halobacteriovorax marinus SJ]
MSKRFPLIDQIRGLAIILMIIFHFFYDLKIFGHNNINFNRDFFWFELPRLIVFLFLIAMGLSLPLVHSPKINWKKFWPRWIKIALGALVITVYTYFTFKNSWVYFGTLHCIALASIVSLPFIRIPKIAGAIGVCLLVLKLFFGISIPWFELSHASMDYIPLFPWIGCIFLGFALWSFNFHQLNPFNFKFMRPLEKMGQHSLLIYMIHQPILYGLVYSYTYLTQS